MEFSWLARLRRPTCFVPPPLPTAGQVMRAVTPLAPTDTLGKAVHQCHVQHLSALPVVEHGILLGWVTETHLLDGLIAGDALDDRLVLEAIEPIPVVIEPFVPLEDLLSLVHATGEPLIPVATASGHYAGMLVRTDVLAAATHRLVPPRVGGMATPLGVYLTTGVARGGVGDLGLVLAGVMMAFLYWVAQYVAAVLLVALFTVTGHPFWRDTLGLLMGEALSGSGVWVLGAFLVATFVLMGVFLALLRVAPLMAGFHAAEHQTVNAIEAGEPLTPAAVGRMSRIHPRCGTNLWGLFALCYVAVTMVVMLVSTPWGVQHLDSVVTLAIFGAFGVLLGWRGVGTWLQRYCTTRPATPAQLASGIRAGQEVLRRHLLTSHLVPTMRQRILGMGLVQVATGVLLAGMVLQLLQGVLDGWVHSLLQ